MVYIERQLNADIRSIDLKKQLLEVFQMVGHISHYKKDHLMDERKNTNTDMQEP